jgi:hypothetical protein
MAKYELPIYGDNDAVVTEHKTNICPWGVYIEAAELAEGLQEKSAREQIEAIGTILKAVFSGLTDDELKRADRNDVINTFRQIVNGGQTIKGTGASVTPKNG